MIAERQGLKAREGRANSALDELRARLIDSMEQERSRIARELHDDFCQRLALLAIDLEQLAQEEPLSQEETRARLRGLWQDATDICSDAGRLSRELHSCRLEQLGLVPAIRGLCSDLSKRHGIRIEFAGEAIPQQVPREIALCLFRIAQEALRNAVKHSQADVIRAELSGRPEALELRVCDAGVGFDPVSAGRKGRLGLMSMRERALLVGGKISINSRPSRGTEVNVRVPLRNARPRPV
jgi:signal transduction histidine kinase